MVHKSDVQETQHNCHCLDQVPPALQIFLQLGDAEQKDLRKLQKQIEAVKALTASCADQADGPGFGSDRHMVMQLYRVSAELKVHRTAAVA